ncbi:MAG: tetratricopeptide repeat protein [Candidatus Kapaibacterium sp.]
MTTAQIFEAMTKALDAITKGNLDEAESLALGICAGVAPDSADYANAQLTLADVARNRGNYDRSRMLAEEVSVLTETLGLRTFTAKAWNSIGIGYFSTGNFTRALEYFEKAYALHEELGEEESVAVMAGNIGNVYSNIGEYAKALDYHLRALELHQRFNKLSLCANMMNSIAIVYLNTGEYTSALDFASRAFELFSELEELPNAARSTDTIANIFLHQGVYDKAIEYYERSLRLNESIGSRTGIAAELGNIGIAYATLTMNDKALEYFTKALALHEELEERTSMSRLSGNIGFLHKELGLYPEALQWFDRAMELVQQVGDKRQEGYWLVGLGHTYRGMGEDELAIEYFQKALELRREVLKSNEFISDNLVGMGAVLARQGKEAEAISCLEEGLAFARQYGEKQQEYEACRELATLYENSGNKEKAFEYFKQYHEVEKIVLSEEAKKSAERFDLMQKIAEKERARELAVRDMEIERLKAEELATELRLMKKDLEGFIERLVQKNQFIRSISTKLEEAMALTNGESRRAVYRVMELLDERAGDEEDRIVVMMQLRAVYGGFMERLKAAYPALSDGELKTCALLQMNLSSPKIAITLGISDRTVEKYRSTIRKKLGIRPQGDIVKILKEYSGD